MEVVIFVHYLGNRRILEYNTIQQTQQISLTLTTPIISRMDGIWI